MRGYDSCTYNRVKSNLKFWHAEEFTNQFIHERYEDICSEKPDPAWNYSRVNAWPDPKVLDRMQAEWKEYEKAENEDREFRKWWNKHINDSLKKLRVGKEIVFTSNRKFEGSSLFKSIRAISVKFEKSRGYILKYIKNKDGSITVHRNKGHNLNTERHFKKCYKNDPGYLNCACDNCEMERKPKERKPLIYIPENVTVFEQLIAIVDTFQPPPGFFNPPEKEKTFLRKKHCIG